MLLAQTVGAQSVPHHLHDISCQWLLMALNVPGVYAPHQVLLAQAVGADYVAPYLGRMADGRSDLLLRSNRQFAFKQATPEPMEMVGGQLCCTHSALQAG